MKPGFRIALDALCPNLTLTDSGSDNRGFGAERHEVSTARDTHVTHGDCTFAIVDKSQ